MIKNFLIKNCTHILTGVGVIGVVGTAILTGKAVIKADRILENEALTKDPDKEGDFYIYSKGFTLKEKIKLTWHCFIPPVIVGSATIAAFISGHVIDTKRLAAMTNAYILSKEAFDRYRSEVINYCGGETDALIKERSEECSKDEEHFNVNKKMTFYEPYSQQSFKATAQDIIFAEARLNKMFQEKYYCTLDEFLRCLNLKPNAMTKKVGWFLDDSFSFNSSFFGNWISIDFIGLKDKDGSEYIELEYSHPPMFPDEPEEWFGKV